MTKAKISEYSATAGDNTDVNGTNIAEGCAPSGINNAIREVMAALKRFETGADGDSVTVGGSLVVSGSATLGDASGDSVTINAGTTTFAASGARITGDFSNATVANRVMFQTSTTNAGTVFGVIPNGTGSASTLDLFQSTDPDNSPYLRVFSFTSAMGLNADKNGTGSYKAMTFYTGGSERMRIDTSGNVGVGTSSPSSALSVARSSGEAVISISNSGTASSWLTLSPGSSGIGYIHNTGNTSTVFTTNGSERMRIDSSGNVGIGTTTPSNGIQAGTSMAFRQANGDVCVNHATGTASGTGYYFMGYAGGIIGSITQNGTTAVAYNTSSDYRLKENIAPMTGALTAISQLNPVTYTWKSDGSAGQGFIAHELQAVVPDCVTGEKDAVDAEGNPVYQGIDTSFLVATLTAAIKEQQAIIESLKARLDAAGL